MAVTVDLATEHVRIDTTSPQTFSHAGAASGVKGVVLAIVHGTSSTDHVSAASYGGVALTRIQRNVDTATKPGAAELWFLGAGVPQGTQTASYTPGATTDDIHAVVITLLGAADLQVVDQDGIDNNVANPSVTLQYTGRTCMAFAAFYGGGASPASFTENANCTRVHDHDIAAFYSVVLRQTTAGTADFAIGGTASTDDVAFAAMAVSEASTTFPQAIAATAVGVAVLSTATIFARTLAAIAVGAAVLTKVLTKVVALAATALGTATLTTVSTYLRTLAATAVGVPSLVKGMFGTLSAAAVGVVSLTTALLFTQTLAAIGTATATLSTAATFSKNLVGSAVGIAGLVADFIAAGGGGAVAVLKNLCRSMLARIGDGDQGKLIRRIPE